MTHSLKIFRCDAYNEEDLDNAVGSGSDENVALTKKIENHLHNRCDYDGDQADFKCFDKCYFNVKTPAAKMDTSLCQDAFWAITCRG